MTAQNLIARGNDLRCQQEHYEDYSRERTRQCICKATYQCLCGRLFCAEDAKEHKSFIRIMYGNHKLSRLKRIKTP